MKIKLYGLALTAIISSASFCQDKKEIAALEKKYTAFTGHKKFFENDNWVMCKFSIVYKLSTAMTSKSMDKNKEVGAKVKSSSGAYAILDGITDKDLQNITDRVAENFIKRMKEEAGVNISTWSSFKDSENTKKIKESAEPDKEIYSVSQGLSYAMTYDETPYYNRIVVLVPGGKKLAKELNKNVMEFNLYIDFAEMVATSSADVSITNRDSKYTYFSWSESADQKMKPGVRLIPNLGSESLGEMGKNLGVTKIGGHTDLGHMFYMGLPADLVSEKEFIETIEPVEGDIPEILKNKRNNKMEYVKTFRVKTTPEKYGDAVVDATNMYLNDYIKIYNNNKNK